MIYKILSFMVNSGYQIYTDIKTKSPDKYYHMTMSRITLLETGILLRMLNCRLQKVHIYKKIEGEKILLILSYYVLKYTVLPR
jgi:hypothetical protein